MLAYLLQVLQTLILALHDGAHSAECCPLELLTAVERVAELHQTHVVLGHVVDEVFGRVDLAQGQLVVILVVEDVHEVGIKRVDVVQLGELGHHRGELVVERLLREFHLLRVKLTNAGDLEVPVDDCRRLALSLGQDDVHEVLGRRDDRDLLKIVMTHGFMWQTQSYFSRKTRGGQRAVIKFKTACAKSVVFIAHALITYYVH